LQLAQRERIHPIAKSTRRVDLPVEVPNTLELMVALMTTKALGLVVPRSTLLRANWEID
jgi:hypothetical protein